MDFILVIALWIVTLISLSVVISEIIIRYEKKNNLSRQDQLKVNLDIDYNHFTDVDYPNLPDYIDSDIFVTYEKFSILFSDEMSKKLH